ncbi:hypothetical protein ACNQFZ_16035 [Schinkia sp. CFF1]
MKLKLGLFVFRAVIIMNNLYNNRGSALLTVLLIIIVILTFSTVLMATVLNASKQTSMSQKQIQATDLAEMGILYFRQYSLGQIKKVETGVKDYHSNNPKAGIDELTRLFCSSIQFDDFPAIPAVMRSGYQAAIRDVTVNRSDCNRIKVNFVSEGNYLGFKKNINGSFIINNLSVASSGNNTGGNITFPSPPSNFSICPKLELCNNKSNIFIDSISVVDKKSDILVDGLYMNGGLELVNNQSNIVISSGNLYVNGKLTIGNQSSLLVQNGDAYFKDITGAVNGNITINGDAYLFGDVTSFKTNWGNQMLIKVTGTVYVADNSDLPRNYSEYCNESKSRGICASTYSYISQSPLATTTSGNEPFLGWTMDGDSIIVEY